MNSIVPGFAFNLGNSAFDWNFTTVPQNGVNGRTIMFERGHGLGGSSSVSSYSIFHDSYSNAYGNRKMEWFIPEARLPTMTALLKLLAIQVGAGTRFSLTLKRSSTVRYLLALSH